MDQLALAKLVVGNKYDLDPTLSYLNTMPGAAGIVAFDRIGEQYNQEREGRNTAEGEVSRLSQVIDAGARKYFGKDSAAVVSAEERAEFEKAVAETGNDAPVVIQPKMTHPGTGGEVVNPPPSSTDTRGDATSFAQIVERFAEVVERMAIAQEAENLTQRAMLAHLGMDPDNLEADIASARSFHSAFVKAYRATEDISDDDHAIDQNAAAWAKKAAALIRSADTAHGKVSPSQSDPIVWAQDLIKGASD